MKQLKRYEVLIIIGIFIAVSSCAAFVFAQTDAPAFVVYSENKWLGMDFDHLPCEYGDSLHDGAWSDAIEPATDNRWNYLIVDSYGNTTIQVFTHGEIDYAMIWKTFAIGDDENPHPDGAYIVTCEFIEAD